MERRRFRRRATRGEFVFRLIRPQGAEESDGTRGGSVEHIPLFTPRHGRGVLSTLQKSPSPRRGEKCRVVAWATTRISCGSFGQHHRYGPFFAPKISFASPGRKREKRTPTPFPSSAFHGFRVGPPCGRAAPPVATFRRPSGAETAIVRSELRITRNPGDATREIIWVTSPSLR